MIPPNSANRTRHLIRTVTGVVRGKPHRTTIADKTADRAPDLLKGDFTAKAPNLKWVTDFT